MYYIKIYYIVIIYINLKKIIKFILLDGIAMRFLILIFADLNYSG